MTSPRERARARERERESERERERESFGKLSVQHLKFEGSLNSPGYRLI